MCHRKSKRSLYANARILQAQMEDLESLSIDTSLVEISWNGNNFEEKKSKKKALTLLKRNQQGFSKAKPSLFKLPFSDGVNKTANLIDSVCLDFQITEPLIILSSKVLGENPGIG